MELTTWTCGLLVLSAVCQPAEAMSLYDPELCYILDGFLGLYGLVITGMFIREKALGKRSDGEYKELPVKREFVFVQRQRKNEQIYQGLSSATRDTYDSLQMQPLPAR
ncbi:T-cell surface glycoprotein CD3 zeta chain [Tautogolabrus adspersus]